MAGFFPIHPGIGGGGGQNPDTAFTGVTIAGNTITFHRQNGQTHPIDLSQIIPDATNESIKNIRVNGKNLVLTKVDNSETMVDLTQLLSASNISFNSVNAGLASTDVQGAIVEVNGKVQNAYVGSNYNVLNGELTLTKANGQNDVLNLGAPFNGVREFSYNPVTQVIDVVDHTNNPVQVDLKQFALEVNGKQVVDGSVTVVAGDIEYDGQTSGIQANNVQGAIDELNGKFIEDITFDTTIDNVTNKPKNTLKKTKNGQPTDVVNHIVTEWQDLEHVKKYDDTNILDYSKIIQNKAMDNNCEIYPHDVPGWGVVEFPVVENQQYTLIRQRASNVKIRFEGNDGIKTGFIYTNMPSAVGGWHRLVFDAPPGSTKAILESNMTHPNEKDAMILNDDKTGLAINTNNPIPFADGQLIQVGSEVSHKFNNSNSSLLSTTVEAAIKELDGKSIKSVNTIQPVDGNITINASHIGYDKTQSQIQADTIQQAIDMLKQDVNLLPTASIYIVPDKQELDNLLGRNVLNHGDLVYVIDSTDVVDYTGQLADGGNPVAMIYDTSLSDTTNRLRVFSKFGSGAINVTASTVAYDDNVTALGATNVQKAVEQLNNKIVNAGTVKSINTLTPQPNGDVELISQVTQTVGQNIVLRVGNQDFATLECMTDQEADLIIDGFVL